MLKDDKLLAQYETKLERSSYYVGVLGILIGDEISKPISVIISAILTVANLSTKAPDDWKTDIQRIITVVIIILLLRTRYLGWKKQTLTRSAEENRWLDYCELIQRHVELIGKNKLAFQRGGIDRINVYLYDKERYFLRAGRFSYNPEYNTAGRKVYSKEEGCLGRSWINGEYFVNDLPDPTKDSKAYERALREMGLPRESVAGLRMKSRLYFGIRFSDGEDHSPLGVIIVESTDPHRFTADYLKTTLESELHYIANITERAISDVPQLSEAAKVGL